MTTDEEVLHLTATLRQMDQLIFRMSQCGSWLEMQPVFQELLTGTMARMNAESDRIRMVLVPEIRRVYATPPEQPKLEGPKDGD